MILTEEFREMHHNRLAVLIALGLVAPTWAAAEDFDDRWRVTATLGSVGPDNDRGIKPHALYAVGLERYLSADWAVELAYSQDRGDFENREGRWRNRELSLTSRHFFGDFETWRPYWSVGVGALRHRADLGPTTSSRGTNASLRVGGGLQANVSERVNMRADVTYRYDMNDEVIARQNGFGDWVFSVGLSVALGASRAPAPEPVREAAAPPPPPPPPPPRTEPKCPPAKPGQIIGPDGCPMDVVIDLRGVNFDFDSAKLRPDAIATLDEAVSILKRYDTIRVEVAGHTCSIGDEAYNQRLSERRAKVVFDYLVEKGISPNRLRWVGYGESRPIASNDTREGRMMNRRTELKVLND